MVIVVWIIILHGVVVLVKMLKKLILFILIGMMVVNIAGSELSTETEKPTLTKDLQQKAIEKENKTKLINTYGIQFQKVKTFNSYKQYKDITIINITIKEGKTEIYARIITNTKKFKEVLK